VSETEGVRDGVLGGLMEMVSFPVEEGCQTCEVSQEQIPFATGEGGIKYRLEYSFNNYPPPALRATFSKGG